MANQILIIGLGQFGLSLARTLAERGAEVLAVDQDRKRVDEAANFVTEAIAMDATDETELARLNPGQRDVAVCAIGDESREASIMCTALLRQMGTPRIIARANDPMLRRILQLVGAHQIVNPENEFGKRFANRLLFRNIIADTPIGDDLQLTEICIQPSMAGKTLIELQLPKKFGVIVAAIRRGKTGRVELPIPDEPLSRDDKLLIVCGENALPKLVKGV